ncbi:MAG: hypothetical protein V1770_04960 [bacterium]
MRYIQTAISKLLPAEYRTAFNLNQIYEIYFILQKIIRGQRTAGFKFGLAGKRNEKTCG